MTILLTGGAGYIGSHTAVTLIEQGYRVVIADNLCNSSPEVLSRLERITGVSIPFYEIDAADRDAMEQLFTREKIDGVIHFAGLKAVGESTQVPLRYYRNNLDASLTLLETMERHGVKLLVFSSSATVYGSENPIPYVEDMPVGGCSSPYGWTKYMIERIFTDQAQADPSLSVVLLRYFNPVGAHESGLIGEDPMGIPNNLMPFVSQTAVGRREKLQIFGGDYPTPDGTCVRDFIHVVDLARGHAAALEYAAGHSGVEAFNLGSGRGASVLELVRTFQETNGVPVPYEFAPRRAGDLPAFYADARKASRELGWETEKTLADMCRDTWNWQKMNPSGFRT